MLALGLLLRINLLLVCLSLFFPSPLTCSDFALQYKEYFILFLSLALALSLVLLQREKNIICLNRIDFWILVFFLYMLADFRSFNVEYFGRIIVVLLAYFVLRNVSVKFLYVCSILIILSSLAQFVYGWSGFVYPWESVSDMEGIFHNTGIWGGFVGLCSIFVFGTGLFLVRRYKIVLLFLFMLLAYLTYESASRAAWVAVIFSLLYFFYVKWEKNVICKVGLFMGLILFLFVCFPKMYHFKAESAMGRIYIWKTSLCMAKEHFLLGTGQGGFQAHYMERQAVHLKTHVLSPFAGTADEIDNPFNEFIKIAVEYGVGGLALLLTLLYHVFHKTSDNTHCTVIFRGMLVGMLVFAFFSYPFMYVQFQLVFVLCLAGISHNDTENVMRLRMSGRTMWVMALYLLAAFPLLKYYYCSLRWERCVNEQRFSEDEKMKEMAVLYPVLKTNADFLTYYAYLYSERGDYVNSVEKWRESLNYKVSYRQYLSLGRALERMGGYDEAEVCWEMASQMIPSRFTPLYLRIEMAVKLKRYEKADSLITLFLMKKRKVDSPDLERMNENVVKWRNHLYRNG